MIEEDKLTINIIANAAIGSGLSGGDRIFIEYAKRWAKSSHKVRVYSWSDGYEMCKRYNLTNVDYKISTQRYNKFGFPFLYLARIIRGCITAFKVETKGDFRKTIIYSASDFWPDSLPAFVMKKRLKDSKWVAGFYLFAQNPLSKKPLYKGRRFIKGLLYYVSQKPTYWLIRRHADMVFVTSDPDRWKFISKRLTPDRVIAIQGGVDTKTPASVPEPAEKKYDAVFIGRFHPQKGVLELIDIWKYVCDMKKDAKLAMIGVGGSEKDIKNKIKEYGLENNIDLLGFQDGIPKHKIFKSSRVVLHPAIYDSGGMAACEAMACGLPGISFDLESLRRYYPKGMIKTPCFDFKVFAENVVKLLRDEELYQKTKQDALAWSAEWDWDKRVQGVLESIEDLF